MSINASRIDEFNSRTPDNSDLVLIQATSNSSYYKSPISNIQGTGAGLAASITGNTAGTAALVSSGTYYLAGGNNITLSQSGNTVSINGGAGGGGSINLSAGSTSNNLTNFVLSNSNGLSFGLNGSTITGSHNALTTARASTDGIGLNTAGTNITWTANSNGLSINAGGYAGTGISTAGANVGISGTNNTNGLSLSITTPAVTNSSLSISDNATSITAARLAFTNLNGVTLSLSTTTGGSATLVGSHNALTSQSNQAFSANGGSSAFQTLTFADTNGVSFTNTNGSIGATVRTDYASSNHSHGNPTLALTNLSGTTASNSAGLTLSLSAAAGGGGADGYNILAAGTQTATTAGTVKFADSNGISFGMSDSTQMTASYTVPSTAGLISAINVSGGTTSNNLSKLTFSDSNGISFGLNGSTLTATVKTDYQSSNANYLTSQSNQALSGSNGSYTFQTATFGSSNGMHFYTTNGSLVGSYTVPTVTNSSATLSDNATSVTLGRLAFTNSNGVTMTLSTSNNGNHTLIASHNGLTTARASNDAIGLNTAQSNVTWTANSSGLSIDARGYAGTATGATNASVTANSNGISVSVGNYLTTARASTDAIGLNTAKTNVTWTVNSSGLSLDAGGYAGTNSTFNGTNISGSITQNSNGLRLDLSVAPGGGGADGYNILAAGTQTANTTGTVKFADSNGISFGMSNSSQITASYTVPTVTNSSWTVSDAATSATVGRLAFTNSNGLTLSLSTSNNGNHTVVGSYTVPSTAGLISAINVSGGTTSNNLSKLTFADSNGISFGLNGSTLTATVKTDYQSSNANYLTSQSNQALSGSNGSFAFQTATFGNLNGLSFYTSNGSLVGSYTVPAAQTGISGVQVSNTTYTSGTITFQNANGISFGSSGANGISASYTVPTQTNQTVGGYFVGNTTGQSSSSTVDARSISIDGAGIVSAGWSNGSIRVSATQSNQAFSAGAASSTFQTLSFQDSNGVSFSNNAGAIRVSHALIGTATAITGGASITANSGGLSFNGTALAGTGTTFNGANVSGSMTLNTNGLNLSLSAGAGGGVTPVASASNGSFSFTTLNFSNANNVTFGTSAGSIVTASVAAPGAAAENNWFALTGANTAGNTTASGSTIGLSGINLTLSGTNGSGINISAPATSSLSATGQVSISTNGSTISIGVPTAVTYSRYNEFKESPRVAGEIGNASLHIQPWLIPNVQFDRVVLHKAYSNASNSSNSFTVSDWVGIYTLNVSTLSLLHSVSGSTNFTGSGTAGSYLSYGGGIKALTLGLTQTLTEGHYWIGVIQRTTTGGGAGHTLNQVLNSQMNSTYRGIMGAATNATNQLSTGFGVYTASTTAMPGSVAISQINGNSSVFLRPPSIYFVSGTV